MLTKTLDFCRKFASQLTFRVDSRPVDSEHVLVDFATTRAAFIAQKTLYGYLKTRMGTRYPSMFEDHIFIDSINIAKINVFAACLSDMSIYAVAYGLRDQPEDNSLRRSVARRCFEAGLENNAEQVAGVKTFSASDAVVDFEKRLADTDWVTVGTGHQYFSASPKALIKWAPIAPKLKQFDEEIVSNSIILAWHGVRQKYAKRLRTELLYKDVCDNAPSIN